MKLINLFTLLLLISTTLLADPKIIPKSTNILIVQSPDPITYETEDNKKCITKNFYCPEIKFKKINKDTNTVQDSWYLNYDMKNITNVNYKTGTYTCEYSSNDIIQYSHTFTNQYCQKELVTSKKELKNGTKLLGYDFKKLSTDIDNIKENDTINLKALALQTNLPLDTDQYDNKGFLNLSELRGAGLTLDTDYIKGTDSKMNLLLNSDSTTNNTQSFSSNTNNSSFYSTNNQNPNKDFFSNIKDSDKSYYQQTKEFLGISDTQQTKDDILNSVSTVADFLDTKNIGYFIELVFNYNDVLSVILMYIAISAIGYKLSIFGGNGIKDFVGQIKNRDPNKKGVLGYLGIIGVGGVLFFLPVGNNLVINNTTTEYNSTPSQLIIQTLVKEGTKFADLFFNNGLVVSLRYLTSSTNTYSKTELTSFTDQIATDLIVTKREIDFLHQQCQGAYNTAGDTFIKSQNNFPLRTDYTLFNHGVPTQSMCKNTESSIYYNLKNIQSNTDILEYKIQSHEKYNGLSPIEKSMKAIATNEMLVARDFGWNQTSLLYSTNEHFKNIGLYLDVDKEDQINQASKNYFNRNQIVEGIGENGEKFIENKVMDGMVDISSTLVEAISTYAFMNMVPGYADTVKMLQNLMKSDSKSDDTFFEKSSKSMKSWAVKKILTTNIFAKGALVIFNKLIDALQAVLPFIVAKFLIIEALGAMKGELIKIFINLKILYYYIDVMLLYFFSGVVYIYVALISEGKTQKVEYALSKMLYLAIYPSMIVFSSVLVFIANNFTKNMLQSTQTISLQTTQLITSIGMSSASIVDNISAGASAALKMGMSGAVNEVLIILALLYVAYKITYSGPEMILKLFNADNVGSDTHKMTDDIINKLQNKSGI